MYRYSIAALLLFASASASADVVLVGVFPGKAAILAVDGAEARSIRVGHTIGAILVVAVDKDRAVIETGGKRKTLLIGQYSAPPSERASATLSSDSRGHFLIQGSVNGAPTRFVVDTGATLVVLPSSEARRLGVEYRRGHAGTTQTANGPATAWRIKLDSVKIGAIEIRNLDAAVVESGLDIALLGMSFLNRVEMHREGPTMTLLKRF